MQAWKSFSRGVLLVVAGLGLTVAQRMRNESLHGTVTVVDDVGVGRDANGRTGV